LLKEMQMTSHVRHSRASTVIALAVMLVGVLAPGMSVAQQSGQQRPPASPPLASQPPARQRPAGGGMIPPDTMLTNDLTGFVSIFDGTLKGWDGDTTFWRAENNTIIGESTPEKRVDRNTFLIWRGGRPRDFELKAEIRLSGTNSGIQIRSAEMPEVGRWVLRGYQADIDFSGYYFANIHEERMRDFLALRGTMTHASTGERPRVIAQITDPATVKGLYRLDGWNRYHIIARGNTITLIVNGQLSAIFIDDDTQKRALEGLIGLQMHVGPPFRVSYRNLYLKTL
jgi:hypothetical protein